VALTAVGAERSSRGGWGGSSSSSERQGLLNRSPWPSMAEGPMVRPGKTPCFPWSHPSSPEGPVVGSPPSPEGPMVRPGISSSGRRSLLLIDAVLYAGPNVGVFGWFLRDDGPPGRAYSRWAIVFCFFPGQSLRAARSTRGPGPLRVAVHVEAT